MSVVRTGTIGLCLLSALVAAAVGGEPKVVLDAGRKEHKDSLRQALASTKADKFADVHDDSAALAAAFKYFADDKARREKLGVDRLLGFVEGRLGVSPPEAWMFTLATHEELDASNTNQWAAERFPTRCHIEDGILTHENVWPETTPSKLLGMRVDIPKGSTLKNGILEQDARRIPIRPLLEQLKAENIFSVGDEIRCAVAWTDDLAFIAFSEYQGVKFPIACLRRSDGKILWRQTVWAFVDQGYGIFGWTEHAVQLRVSKDRVHAFGYCFSAYVESFSLNSGERLLRFGTGDLKNE